MKIRDLIALVLLVSAQAAMADPHPNLGARPPRGAVVLFSGKDAIAWHQRGSEEESKWDILNGDLVTKAGTGDIVSKQVFGDYRLHLEFWLPLLPNESGQGKANSGVYQQGRYEIQVLDSFNNPTYKAGGCGSIYDFKDPDKDAIIPPEHWNSYDITFRAARYGVDGKQTENPRITVLHNGIKIHDNVELTIPHTGSGLEGLPPGLGPIMLQAHGAPIHYRNVWVLPLGPQR